jgi:hypothetical protein
MRNIRSQKCNSTRLYRGKKLFRYRASYRTLSANCISVKKVHDSHKNEFSISSEALVHGYSGSAEW